MPRLVRGTASVETQSQSRGVGHDRCRRPAGLASTAMIAGLVLACGSSFGQSPQPPAAPPQSPAEINKRLQDLEQQIRDLRKALEASQQAKPQAPPAPPPAPAAQPGEVNERLDEHEKKLDVLTDRVDELKPGTEQFLLSGFVSVGLTVPQHGVSTFEAAFKPVFLWRMSDTLLAAASVEFELADNATETNVEYMNINWDATDWLALRGGVILHPLDTFQQSLHPQWINKLPDNPLFAGDSGLAPEKGLGFEARGGFRTDIGKFTYSAWVTNGPSLITSGDQAGQLDLTEFSDVNSNKAVGGRIGYLPIPELELAYAAQYNNVTPSGSGLPDINLILHDLGASYVTEKDWLGGRIDARVEFIFADFQDEIDLGSGPFNNDRTGGYAQLAYRPTKLGGFVKDLEGVVRYDFLTQPDGAPLAADEDRFTIGLDYWFNPKTVFKIAYEFDHVKDPTGLAERNNTFFFQVATGF